LFPDLDGGAVIGGILVSQRIKIFSLLDERGGLDIRGRIRRQDLVEDEIRFEGFALRGEYGGLLEAGVGGKRAIGCGNLLKKQNRLLGRRSVGIRDTDCAARKSAGSVYSEEGNFRARVSSSTRAAAKSPRR
jgi:hypothetical protein